MNIDHVSHRPSFSIRRLDVWLLMNYALSLYLFYPYMTPCARVNLLNLSDRVAALLWIVHYWVPPIARITASTSDVAAYSLVHVHSSRRPQVLG